MKTTKSSKMVSSITMMAKSMEMRLLQSKEETVRAAFAYEERYVGALLAANSSVYGWSYTDGYVILQQSSN